MFHQSIYMFLSVVEQGSFSKAAKLHYVSQSAISQQIVKLEKNLGVTLFDRSTYRPTLTSAGQYYYMEMKQLLSQYREIENNTRAIEQKNKEGLVIGITGTFERKYIVPLIKTYRKEHNIHVSFHTCNFGEAVTLLENEQLDIAFGIENDFKRHTDLIYQALYAHKVCAICSMNHPFANQNVTMKELLQENMIALSKNVGNGYFEDFMESFRLDGYRPNIVKAVDSQEDLLLSVSMGEGIAFTSKEMIEPEDDVAIIELQQTHHHANFAVAYTKKNTNPQIEPLIAYIAEKMKKL